MCGTAALTVCQTPVRLMSSVCCQAPAVELPGRGAGGVDSRVGDDDVEPAQFGDAGIDRGGHARPGRATSANAVTQRRPRLSTSRCGAAQFVGGRRRHRAR